MTGAEERLYNEIWKEKVVREAADLARDGELRGSAAERLIGSGERLLDIGCGEGSMARRLKDRFHELHGIDISPEAVKLAVQNGLIAKVANLNNEPVPYTDAFFDVVVSLDVIEHIFDPIQFLREIHRILRPGGELVLSTPNIRKIQRIASLIKGRFPRTSYDPVGFDGGHLHYFTSLDLKILLEEQKFKVQLIDGICGDRRTWKYRLAVGVLGTRFEKEFLSSAILVKAIKL